MTITVRYFASLKERIGRTQDQLAYRDHLTVLNVWQLLNNQELPANTLTAVNMDYVELDYVVHDGDEVAFFPPVTGG
jgi:molybdopterin synthase sulfur carrier subunit